MQKILVIGGTGMIGKPVTHALLKAGFTVSLLARHPQQAQQLFPEARIVPGDVFESTHTWEELGKPVITLQHYAAGL